VDFSPHAEKLFSDELIEITAAKIRVFPISVCACGYLAASSQRNG
jgi:hypothetical protein